MRPPRLIDDPATTVHVMFPMTLHPRFDGVPRQEELERPRPADDGGAAQAREARHLAMLAEIADMAMDLARSAYRRARARDEAELGEAAAAAPAAAKDAVEVSGAASAEDRIEALKGALAGVATGGAASGDVAGGGVPSRADPSLVFARLSGVLFRAVAMEKEIAEAAKVEAAEEAVDYEMTPERKAKVMERWQLLLRRKNLIVKVLQDAIAKQRPNEDAEAAGRALNDKMLEFERSKVLNYTIRANAERWCETLGLTLDWTRWENEDWALEEADGQLAWDKNP